FKSGDVIFVGDVNVHELEDLFLSSILVSPIFIGSGLRRKILFAMRKGTPVVSTTLGARGIPYVQDSRDIILADNAKAFENGVRNLFLNKELRKTVSENSRKLFETEFNFEKLYNIRRKLYE
ncbi:MAG: glycosyltransferase, partial [Candidatus Omnitrophica bacterium]|nr:glycosyltransferase [Candidatus Omnitrophota bacterium]